MTSNTEFSTLQISDITVELWDRSNKWVQSIDISIDGATVVAEFERMGSTETARQARVRFKPPRVAVSSLQVTVRLRYKNILKNAWRDHEFKIQADELRAVQHQGDGRKEWRRVDDKLSVVVGLTSNIRRDSILIPGNASFASTGLSTWDDQRTLTPTTESILRDCPRFRILVMGKTGVGKSRLINKTFGVDDAIVEDAQVGHADINQEIFSKENPHFILHDSKGFEHGDDLNVKTVHKFVDERSRAPLIKDKLHAIWLCMDIPIDNGRLLETGIEDFLRLKVEDKLGQVPVIAVFTKYDHLTRRLKRTLNSSRKGLTDAEFDQLLEEKAEAMLQDLCIDPFEEFVGKRVPWIAVSSEPKHEARLAELIQLTYDHVREHFADAAVVTAIAQRVSPRVNIQASIAVGRRKYWEGLASSSHFRKKTMKDCLDVIHADIVAIWRFNDPHHYLSTNEFKAMISNISPPPSGQAEAPPNLKRNFAASLSLLAGIAGIVGALGGPAAPIVLPIAAMFVFGKWAYDVYQQTTGALRHLMEYIIDLTLVLQNVFWLQALVSEGRPLSRRHIKAAANGYLASNVRQTLYFQIDKHVHSVTFALGPDTTLETIIRLIESSTIDTSEAFEQRTNISRYSDVFSDETYAEEWES